MDCRLLFVDEKDGNCYEVDHHRDWTPRSELQNLIMGISPTQLSWTDLCLERNARQGAIIPEEWPLKYDHTIPEIQLLDNQGNDLYELFPDHKVDPIVVHRPSRAVLGLVTKEDHTEASIYFYASATVFYLPIMLNYNASLGSWT